jgi:hypothetical protein
MSNAYAELHSFIVDPQRDGIDNALWKAVTGTPIVSGGKFRFNANEGLIRADLLYGRVIFPITLPLTGGETPQAITDLVADIEFGLKNLSLGNIGKISVLFDKSEDILTFSTYDRFGTVQSTNIVLDTAWNSAVTSFIIDWFNDRIVLSVVNTSGTSEKVIATHKTRVGQHPLNPFIKVTGAENLDVSYVAIEKAKSSSLMLI